MVQVFRGMFPTEAYLVQHWLRRNGIAAEVRGDLATGRGEIPIPDSMPSVWVPPTDEPAAAALIAEFEAQPRGEPWVCLTCGEESPPNFGSCWSCGSDRSPGTPDSDPTAP